MNKWIGAMGLIIRLWSSFQGEDCDIIIFSLYLGIIIDCIYNLQHINIKK